jgi:hypothetical protein
MLAVFGLVLLSACTPGDPAIPTPEEASEQLTIQKNGVSVTMETLPGWNAYTTAKHQLVLSEHPQPVRESGVYNGISLHIWLPEMQQPVTAGTPNTLSDMLRRIIQTTRTGTQAAISDPQTFEWAGNEAAYYLLNNGDENVSMILAVRLPDEAGYLALNASTSMQDSSRLPETLPQVLASLHVNEVAMGNDGLDMLPQVLSVPSYNPEAAMEASSEP